MAIILKDIGPNKVEVIKVYCELTGGNLEDGKNAVENLPVTIDVLDEVSAMNAFTEVGAIVENDKKSVISDTGKENGEDHNRKIEYAKIDPDEVGKMDRKELLSVLDEIKRLTGIIDGYFHQIVSANDEIEKVKKHAEELRNAVSGWVYGVTIVLVIVFSIGMIPVISWFGIILAVGVGLVIQKNFLKVIDFAKNGKKREKEANDYLETALPPLQNQIVVAQQNIVDIRQSEESVWAIDVIGEDLFSTESVEQIIDIVKSRRADNLKEALNKYDSMAHTNRMEEMQRAIQNASEISAEEAVKQTAYAKETEKNTHQAATAAKATAYHTRKISKNIRRK